MDDDYSQDMEHSQSIVEDLSTAVARLSLENGEIREGKQAMSYTTTPNNTPFGRNFILYAFTLNQ